MIRASWVVNFQSTDFCIALRSQYRAFASFRNVSIFAIRRARHCLVNTLSSISATVSHGLDIVMTALHTYVRTVLVPRCHTSFKIINLP